MRRMFSEKQIKEMISAGAQSEIAEALEGDISIGGDLSVTGDQSVGGDLEVTGDLQAKTIKQSQPSYSVNLSIGSGSGISVEQIYSKLLIVNNMLYIIVNCKLTNTTEESKTMYQIGGTNQIEIDSDVADKIYDLLGQKVSEVIASDTIICATLGEAKDGSQPGSISTNSLSVNLVNLQAANQLKVQLYSSNGVTIAAGASKYLTGRMFVSLF